MQVSASDLLSLDSGSDSSEEEEDPKIVYAAVAKRSVILARFTPFDGNFEDVADHVLNKLGPSDRKLTLLAEGDQYYMYHVIQEDDGLVFICIADDDFARPKAFLFLQDVKSRFQEQFSGQSLTSIPYSLNSRFSSALEKLMTEYSSAQHSSLVALADRMHHQIEEMEQIGIRNIDSAQSLAQFEMSHSHTSLASSVRSERVPLLNHVTTQISSSFCHCSRRARIILYICFTIFLFGIAIVVVMIVLLMLLCGREDNSCVK